TGGYVTQTVPITIGGTNEAPVITSPAQSGCVTEDMDSSATRRSSDLTRSGAVAFTDADTLDTHTVTFAPQGSGYLGTFALDPSHIDTGNGGSIGWSFSVAESNPPFLQSRPDLTHKDSVTIKDGHGEAASAMVCSYTETTTS